MVKEIVIALCIYLVIVRIWIDRQLERHRWIDRKIDNRWMDRQMGKLINGVIYGRMDKQMGGWMDKQIDAKIDRQVWQTN